MRARVRRLLCRLLCWALYRLLDETKHVRGRSTRASDVTLVNWAWSKFGETPSPLVILRTRVASPLGPIVLCDTLLSPAQAQLICVLGLQVVDQQMESFGDAEPRDLDVTQLREIISTD